jgi:hypothetical protein
LVAVANSNKGGNNGPNTQEERNHRKFDIYIGYRVEN